MSFDERGTLRPQTTVSNDRHHELGRTPTEFVTTGDLAVLPGRLPVDTPVRIVGHTRTDSDLDEGTTDSRTVLAATITDANTDETNHSLDEHPDGHRVTRPEPGVLGRYVVAVDKPVPDHTFAYEQWERGIDGLHDGDAVTVLGSFEMLVRDVAQILTGETDYTLHERITDNDLRGQLHLEGERLIQAAVRIAVLRDRVHTHLAGR